MKKRIKPKTISKIGKILSLMEKINEVRAFYEMIDDLTLQLVGEDIPEVITLNGEKVNLSLVDNFAGKNTAWRVAPIKRYELKVKKVKVKNGKAK